MSVHASHYQDLKHAAKWFIGALLILAFTPIIRDATWLNNSEYYLATHSLLEIMSVTVAVLIFSVGWNARKFVQNTNLLVFSCLMLAVGLLDFIHAFSFPGMPDFITPAGPEKAINFWLSARFVSVFALLTLALMPWFRLWPLPSKVVLSVVVLLTLGLSYALIFYPNQFPSTYTYNTGLTAFKVISEYVLIGVLLLAALLFALDLRQPKADMNTSALIASALLMMVSEYFFTLYRDLSDAYNFFGHVFKIFAYVFLYRALIVESITRPYFRLADEVERTSVQAEQLAHEVRLDESLLSLSDFAVNNDKDLLLDYGIEHARYVVPCASASLYDVVNDHLQLVAQSGKPEDHAALIDRQRLTTDYHYFINDAPLHCIVLRATSEEMGQVVLLLTDSQRTFNRRDEQTLTVWLKSLLTWYSRIYQEEQVNTLSLAVEQNPNPIFITDTDARIEYANKAYVESSGYSREELLGKNPRMTGSGRTPPNVFADMWRHLLNGKPWSGELINRTKSGDEVVELTTIFPLKDRRGEIVKYISFKNDVTEAIENEKKIHRLSFFDQLTGLPNRTSYQADFERRIGEQADRPAMMLYVNLDNFKLINDAMSIDIGNQVLCTISSRLQLLESHDCSVYRMSGDIFVLLMTDSDIRDAGEMAVRVLNTIRTPMHINEQNTVVTASIGVVQFQYQGTTPDEVLQHAEVAMYEAKKKGRNTFQVYNDEMQAGAIEQLAMLNALNFALERDEFSLVFQPQVTMHGQRLVGAEALLRWYSQELGEVPPSQFIPLAERSGLISAIDKWVFRKAARQVRQWQEQGIGDIKVAVNLSASRFEAAELVKDVQAIVREEQVAPQSIELELTEVVALQNPEQALITIAALQEAGFHVSLDDFGTGYSSISYLKRFGFDKLKIDKSFIDDLTVDNQTDIAIVSGIIALARSLKMLTVAEGVETKEQWDLLLDLGCDKVQGYYCSRPLSAENFAEFAIKKLKG